MKNLKRLLCRSDLFLLAICVLISAISISLLHIISCSFFPSNRIFFVQLGASIIGIITAMIVSNINYKTLSKLWKIHIPITTFFVILTFFIGTQRGGADDKAWIMLPFGLSIQPSEFLKISFILSFALHLSRVNKNINKISSLLLLIGHLSFPIVLTHLQGDDGAALMFLMISIIMLFSAGISWWYVSSAIAAAVTVSPFIWKILNTDQKERILITLHPENDQYGFGYQQFRGLISIGNGGIFGQGFLNKSYRFVPEIQNDFIFSFIGQIAGFVGSVIVLILLLVLILRILFTGLKTNDPLGKFICIGVFAMIATQIIFNIGMNLSVLPVIGITLPLISSGGSSIVTTYFGIGLVLSVYLNNNSSLFNTKIKV